MKRLTITFVSLFSVLIFSPVFAEETIPQNASTPPAPTVKPAEVKGSFDMDKAVQKEKEAIKNDIQQIKSNKETGDDAALKKSKKQLRKDIDALREKKSAIRHTREKLRHPKSHSRVKR